jgi:hypothetical protein
MFPTSMVCAYDSNSVPLRKMGNHKKCAASEVKGLCFSGDQKDFESFRPAVHSALEEKNPLWLEFRTWRR